MLKAKINVLAVDKILEALRDDRNSLDKVIELLSCLEKVPEILENQRKILELLQSGSSPEFRSHVLAVIDRLNSLSGDNNTKGKEEKS